MSIIAVTHVLQLKGLSSSEKLVLVDLAERHNRKTGQCNPTYDTVAKRLDWTERHVKRLVKSCEVKGVLSVHRSKHAANKNAANQYAFPGLRGDNLGKPKAKGGDNLGKEGVTNSVKNLTENVTQNQNIESEVRTGTPVALPQEERPSKKTVLSQREKHKVYCVWEDKGKKFQVGKVILTEEEKKQLKDAARFFRECELDPCEVIAKVVSEWDRFKVTARLSRGWSDSFEGGGLSESPSARSLVAFRKEAVEYFNQDALEAKKREEQDLREAQERAERDAARKAWEKACQEHREAIDTFMMADPVYRDLRHRLDEHLAKETLPGHGMTEADFAYLAAYAGKDGLYAQSPWEFWQSRPDRIWTQIKIDLEDNLQEHLRESKLEKRAEETVGKKPNYWDYQKSTVLKGMWVD